MKKKHDTNKEGINRTDELINDYLQDVFGDVVDIDNAGVSENVDTVTVSAFFQEETVGESYLEDASVLPVSIQHNCFLVPTIKLLSSHAGNESYSKEQAILILLNALYFLRRPLSPRVRQCFLNLSEQVINDYQFSSFKHRMTRQGIFA